MKWEKRGYSLVTFEAKLDKEQRKRKTVCILFIWSSAKTLH